MESISINFGGRPFREITRDQAEELFQNSPPLGSKIEQSSEELRLLFSLPARHSLLVIYDLKNRRETFYLDELK